MWKKCSIPQRNELNLLIEDFGDDLSLFEQSNPLRNVLYVKATDPQQTAKVAKKLMIWKIHMKLCMVRAK